MGLKRVMVELNEIEITELTGALMVYRKEIASMLSECSGMGAVMRDEMIVDLLELERKLAAMIPGCPIP